VTDAHKIIALAADHAGFELKTRIADFLRECGYQVLDLGAYSTERVDYPDYGFAMGEAIAQDKAMLGIAVCGSGIGIDIAINRNPQARSALCHDVTSARLARAHNDANVLSLGARLIGIETALECVKVFLETPFEGGRHADRVKKLGRC
jgi:ribose 5-phosphate isomerase B